MATWTLRLKDILQSRNLRNYKKKLEIISVIISTVYERADKMDTTHCIMIS